MRLIDADALKQTLKENYVFYGFSELLDDFYKAIDDAPTIEPKQEWIPCDGKERLPEDDCIVTGKLKYPWETEWNYFVDVASSDGDYIDGYWDTFKDWDEGQEVHIIAWMPLPSPYQPKERSRR